MSVRIVWGTMMRSKDPHQANLLATQVLNEVKDVKTSVQEVLLLLVEDNKHDGVHKENRENFAGNSTNSNDHIFKLLKKLGIGEQLKSKPKSWKSVHEYLMCT